MQIFIVAIALMLSYEFIAGEIGGRISDGEETAVDQFPWIVSIRFNAPASSNFSLDICGGSIISEEFVLTAASCFFGATSLFETFSIRAGMHDITNPNPATQQDRAIDHIIAHPDYDSKLYLNDLALVRVSPPFDLNTISVTTIPLASSNTVENTSLTVIGWGVFNQSNPSVAASLLRQATVQENLACSKNILINATTQLCAPGMHFLVTNASADQFHSLWFVSLLGACLRT